VWHRALDYVRHNRRVTWNFLLDLETMLLSLDPSAIESSTINALATYAMTQWRDGVYSFSDGSALARVLAFCLAG
jgi:hypothetical protein